MVLVLPQKQQQITKQLQQKLRQHINDIAIQAHWEKKWHYRWGNTNMVAWDMAETVICNLPAAQHQWVSKVAAKFVPCGINMKRWKLRTEDQCPRCHQWYDAQILQPHPTGKEPWQSWTIGYRWQTYRISSKDYGIGNRIDPRWRTSGKSGAALEQALLGWHNMLEGILLTNSQEEHSCY